MVFVWPTRRKYDFGVPERKTALVCVYVLGAFSIVGAQSSQLQFALDEFLCVRAIAANKNK